MSLLIKGLEKLSQLEIDADKDWQTKGITNIKEIAAAMAKGDIGVKGNSALIRFQPGNIGFVLTSGGPLHLPSWMPGAALEYWIPASIESSHSEQVVAVDQSINKNAALASAHYQAYVDTPADYIRRLDCAIALADAEAVLAGPDQTIANTISPRSGLSILCDGFVEETALAAQTDKTAQARDAAANDLNLNPMTDSVGDMVYIGSNYKFWQAQVMVDTVGVGNWLNSWFYWNGAWVPVVNEVDGSNEWQFGVGLGLIHHTPQGDWALLIIQGMNLYWIRSRTTAFTSRVTKPLGSQVWVAIA